MSLITRMLKQTAVYWALASSESGGVDWDANGLPSYAAPVEIRCRWEDVAEEVLLPDGTQYTTRSRVFVDRDVDVSGVLLLGELTSGMDQVNPKENPGAWEIKRFDKNPDLRCRRFVRTAYL